MKKITLNFLAFVALCVFAVMPHQTQAADCNEAPVNVTDYVVKATLSVNIRDAIQGGEEEDCPSNAVGSLAVGQEVVVVGEIETGFVINEQTNEFGKWLYIEIPGSNGSQYAYLWNKYAETVPNSNLLEGRTEVALEDLPESPVTNTQDDACEIITEVVDYFVMVQEDLETDLNVRDGVCNGQIVDTFSAGAVVKVIGEIGVWRYVEIPNDGGRGFIHSDYVDETDAPIGRDDEQEVLVGDDKAVVRKIVVPNTPVDPTNPNPTTLLDVVGHPYENAIRYLESNGIVQGYPDGFYKPDLFVNRAEFTKIVVEAKLGSEPFSSADACMTDVKEEDWFSSYVCYAKSAGIIDGYEDASFKPGDPINLVEASKILVNTFEIPKGEDTEVWYVVYLAAMENKQFTPDSFTKLGQSVDRGQMAEMMSRILQDTNNRASTRFVTESQPGDTANVCVDDHLPSSVDVDIVRSSWLGWHNEARVERGLSPFALQEGLDYSATLWAKQNAEAGAINHVRADGIELHEWFADLGFTFDSADSYSVGENLGLVTYSCSDNDCTDEVIAAMEIVFNAYMAEENTDSVDHYQNIVNMAHDQLGLGFVIDEEKKFLYLTSHYAEEVEAFPDTCE